MATITSVGSGNWSVAGTWDSGVPVDGDSVVIASGHSVVFDVDTSGFANGIAGLTITGTLSVSTSTTSYLKMKAATYIGGAGTFNVGTSGTPIPFAVKFTLTGGSGWYVQGSGGLTMGVYGAEPTYTYAKLTGAESAGSTRLEIDTDLTGDIWAVGDTIHIDNVNMGRDSEARAIGAIASTYIDITAGLTGSKIAGSYVILVTRNVSITGLGANILQNFASGKLTIAGGSFTSDTRHVASSGVVITISGGVFANNSAALVSCHNSIIGNGIFTKNNQVMDTTSNLIVSNGLFSGHVNAFAYAQGMFLSGGIIAGNTRGLTQSAGTTVSGGSFIGNGAGLYIVSNVNVSGGSFIGNTNGLWYSSGSITGATFTSNTYDTRESQFTAFNQALTSTVENYAYTNLSRNVYSESLDHDQTAGAFKAWTKGGITTSVATPVPTGLTIAYQIALENATVEGFFNHRLNVPAGKTITLTLYLRKSASMTYLPRVWVHKYGTEPFTTAGDILHTFTMTDSTDTWETDTYSYTNTADYDIELNCRFVAMNATGYVYGQVVDTFAIGISKARLLGGV